jgi:hypothetical protein
MHVYIIVSAPPTPPPFSELPTSTCVGAVPHLCMCRRQSSPVARASPLSTPDLRSTSPAPLLCRDVNLLASVDPHSWTTSASSSPSSDPRRATPVVVWMSSGTKTPRPQRRCGDLRPNPPTSSLSHAPTLLSNLVLMNASPNPLVSMDLLASTTRSSCITEWSPWSVTGSTTPPAHHTRRHIRDASA